MSRGTQENKRSGFPVRKGYIGVGIFVLALGAIIGFALEESQLPASSGNTDPSTYTPVGAVSVSEQNVDLGQIPLNKMVTQVFRLRNISQDTVQLGRVSVGVLEGC